jgi:MinD superfamily P-loop ATPase
MIISVAGVKGGAGKTLVSTSLALAAPNCRFLDCDVEEPNGHLYLQPGYRKRQVVSVTVPRPKNWLRADVRTAVDFCPYNALALAKDKLIVFKELCTGCGGCFLLAPKGVLVKEDLTVGAVKMGGGRNGIEVVTGELRVGSQRTGRVVSAVKSMARSDRKNIVDCPPGSARSMLEAVRGSDYCLLVTEATPFGLEDLRVGVEAVRIADVKFGVVVNRLRNGYAGIDKFCKEDGIPIMLEIPFSRDIAEASSRGKALPDIESQWAEKLSRLWECMERI